MKITSNIGHNCVGRNRYYRRSIYRDSSVGIATGYKLDDRVSIPGRVRNFSAVPSVHIGSGTHSSSYTNCIGDSFSTDKAAGVLS
jgi:hypothetical protein